MGRESSEKNRWMIIPAAALVLLAVFAWWQQRELKDLQIQAGMRAMDDYRILGITIRELRITCEQAMVSKEMDQEWLRRSYFSRAVDGLNHRWIRAEHSHSNRLLYFLHDVWGSLGTIAEEQPVSEAAAAHLETLRRILTEMEGIFFRETLWDDQGKAALEFSRGRRWPEVLPEIDAVLGEYTFRDYQYIPDLQPED